MGIGIFYLLIILVILTTCCLIWLFISIKKKSKIGIIIPILFFLFVGFLFSLNYIDENTISNEDVKNDLQVINLNLKDTFKILENDVSGMPERYQKTKIEISNADKQKLIEEIINSKNYEDLKTEEDIKKNSEKDDRYTSKNILNYKYPDFYSREFYTEINSIPTRFFLKLDIKSNELEYQKIED
ncbi:hypothetical protein [Empedobacter stercoris]|uniref:hypothetical protein n=1 Tax=Empedobacter stercoris TaxID=1628248 RepID=UPI001CE06A9A|nr:hypothetical protein [Empedobacter stercoris]MCA4777813.1 hypothetical protein [Empedobacter stercoris]